QGADCLLLPDAIHATDSLFDAHGIPRQVVVHNDVTELEVQALATGIRRDQRAHLACELPLHATPLLHVHGAVQARHAEPASSEELAQHLLRWNKLRKDEKFERRVALFLLKAVYPVEERLGLRVWRICHGSARKVEEHPDLAVL